MDKFRQSIEKKTVYKMIKIYCNHHHNTKQELCSDCSKLHDYTVFKYDKCPFGSKKPVCSKCKIHCYEKEKRNEIKKIMRFSGPKMLLKHPIDTIIYMYHKWTVKNYSRK